MDLRDEIEQFLVQLGNSSQEVYETLKARGITGKRSVSCACPLANALYQRFGAPAFVTHESVLVMKGVGGKVVSLPAAVSEFVVNFDLSEYPDLETM